MAKVREFTVVFPLSFPLGQAERNMKSTQSSRTLATQFPSMKITYFDNVRSTGSLSSPLAVITDVQSYDMFCRHPFAKYTS